VRLGFFGANVGPMATPAAGDVCAYAEELGYHSMWTGEHMVLPVHRPDYLKIPADWAFADPLVMFGFLAARTRHIELCTGVLLLPQRHPVHLAKELATLDVLCGGRLRVGVGVGHLVAEMDAMDAVPEGRQARAIEALAVMRALWAHETDFDGETYSYTGVDAYPLPVRPGGPPIVMGGWSKAALRRAARHAQGWYGFGLDPAATADAVAGIRAEAAAIGRDLSGFVVTATPTVRMNEALVREFADAGVDELVLSAESSDLDGVRRKLANNAPEALGVAPARWC
jgi:probable F420-dependent oxidoreductase